MLITAEHLDTTVKVTLHGEITEARVTAETAIAQYRAQQLTPAPPKPERSKRMGGNPWSEHIPQQPPHTSG